MAKSSEAQTIISMIDVPDLVLDSIAEQQDAVYRDVENYAHHYAVQRGIPARALLPSHMTKPRYLCEQIRHDDRLVNSSQRVPGIGEINTRDLVGRTVDKSVDYDGEPMVPWDQGNPRDAQVSFLLHRSKNVVVRHIIRGSYGFDDAMRAIDGPSREDFKRAWKGGSMLGRDVNARIRALEGERIATQCDFGVHHHDDAKDLISWPIACGQFLVVLRCCQSHWVEFIRSHEINIPRCKISDPNDRIG